MFFALNMIQSRCDSQSGLITDFRRIADHSGTHCIRLNATSRFTLPHSLAAAIAPRRQEKPARRQFSPLGKASCVMEPDADCRRGRLVPRFRLPSRSATSGDSRLQFCNPLPLINPLARSYKAYLPARWKGKVHTSNSNRPLKGLRCRLR